MSNNSQQQNQRPTTHNGGNTTRASVSSGVNTTISKTTPKTGK